MVMDHYTQLTSSFRNILLTTLEPIEKTALVPRDIYNWLSQDFATLNQLKTAKSRLETENLLLKVELQQLNRLKIEVSQLNRLLGTASQYTEGTSQIALVTSYSNNPLNHFFSLHIGTNAGLKMHQPVINSYGIMGKIVGITPFSSRVLLITDPDSQVPVRIQRTGQRGILTGKGSKLLSLQFIPKSSSIIKGDIIETTGLGNIYPEGYPIAKVYSCNDHNLQPYYKIKASSTAQLKTSNKVLVLDREEENNYD